MSDILLSKRDSPGNQQLAQDIKDARARKSRRCEPGGNSGMSRRNSPFDGRDDGMVVKNLGCRPKQMKAPHCTWSR
ncbi:hypothetical protein [Glutamicibacter arilaitensis]|uniref:hypothetical protein n=1 Tax=Glutamicibacter arilaitensis TaxID=256701 RepID=UPI003A9394ED